MKYQLKLNGKYINSFASYNEVVEVRDSLQKRFKNAKVEIIAL